MMNEITRRAVLAVFVATAFTVGLDAAEPQWIRPKGLPENAGGVLTREFAAAGKVKRATLEYAAAGIAEVSLNGKPVCDELLGTPAANYEKTFYSRRVDVTPLVAERNAISVELGDGWYGQNLAWSEDRPTRMRFGDPAFRAKLELEFADGAKREVVTDGEWRGGASATLWNNLYGGEIFDARVTAPALAPVAIADEIKGEVKESKIPFCRVMERVAPKSVRMLQGEANQMWLYDFGRILAGTVELKLPKDVLPGSRIQLRFAENLREDGSPDFRSEGVFAIHQIPSLEYVAGRQSGGTVWRSKFFYTSFRYVELSGLVTDAMPYSGKAPDDFLTALFVATDQKPTGSFTAADPELAHLLEVMRHTYRCNVHDHPEDCPGREKSGWLGDAQLLVPYGLANFDSLELYRKFLDDLEDANAICGFIPYLTPGRRSRQWGAGSPAWRVAVVTIPYYLWLYENDVETVRRHWPMLKQCLKEFADSAKGDLLDYGLGDHCSTVGHSNPRRLTTTETSTLTWIDALDKAMKLADALGYSSDHDEWHVQRYKTAVAFNAKFYDAKAKSYERPATAAWALALGLVPKTDEKAVEKAMLAEFERNDWALASGILSLPPLVKTMLARGYGAELKKILFNPRHPGFGFVLADGATTLPEALCDPQNNWSWGQGAESLNHPMQGACLISLWEELAGLRPLKPGFSEFELDPKPQGDWTDFSLVRYAPGVKDPIKVKVRDGYVVVTVPEGTRCRYRPENKTLEPGVYRFGKKAPTKLMLFFDTEDFTCDRSNDAIRDIANVLTEEGVVGHFAIVGLLGSEIARLKRQDVIDALKPHLVGSQTLNHSLHPTVCERTDSVDYATAYANAMADEGKAVEILKKTFGRDRIDFAVPPGNSFSYASIFAFADLGCRYYAAGGLYNDLDDPFNAEGVVARGGRRWKMWFCNTLQLPYFNAFNLEDLMPTCNRPMANPGNPPDVDAWMEKLADEDAAIIYMHPHLAVKLDHWDGYNYLRTNHVEWGKWNVAADRPKEETAQFYANLHAFIRKYRNDPRFEFTDTEKVGAAIKARRPLVVGDLAVVRDELGRELGPLAKPGSYSVADVFQAVCAFLGGAKEFKPGKVYGFLERPEGVTKSCRVKTADLRAAAKKLDPKSFIPAQIEVGGEMIGPADFLFAALDALVTVADEVAVSPREQLGSFRNCPALEVLDIKNNWCVHAPTLNGKVLDDRLRYQLWTIRFE